MGLLDTRNFITANLEKGVSRQDIFQQHVEKNPQEAAKLAFAIASVPQKVLRQKFIRHNAVLFLSLIAIAVLSFISELPIDFEQSTLFIFIRIALPLVFSYFVYHFHGGIYRLLGVWCIIDLIEMLVLGKYITLVGLLRLIIVFVSALLSFLIARKVFFHLKFLGPKQDEQGRYLL